MSCFSGKESLESGVYMRRQKALLVDRFFGLLNLRWKGLFLMIAEAGALAGMRKAELRPESSAHLQRHKTGRSM